MAPNSPKEAYKYPSVFGSHKSMINVKKTEELNDSKFAVLEDEFGFYTTEVWRIDSGGADPNRWREKRLGKLFTNKKESDK